MNKCTMLLVTNEIIHNCRETACNVEFTDSKGNMYVHMYDDWDIVKHGIFIHTDCWKFIYNRYNIKLKFGDLPKIYEKRDYYKVFSFINYGIIEKYWFQDFDFLQIIKDKNETLCYSPLVNSSTAKRIMKNIKKLKLKGNRKGPNASATFYKEGDIKLGNDNNFWIIKNNKWIRSKDKVIEEYIEYNYKKLDSKTKYKLNKIPYIGESNRIPYFIKDIKWNKNILILKIVHNKEKT